MCIRDSIIRASIWSPYGKNFADPHCDQKDDHIAKYCHKPSQSSYSLSFFMSFTKLVFWNSYFKILAEFHYQRNDDQFAKYCQTPRNHRFQELFCCWSLGRHFGALTVKFAPHSGPKYGQFAKDCHRRFIHRFPLLYLCVSCKQHFGVLSVKILA